MKMGLGKWALRHRLRADLFEAMTQTFDSLVLSCTRKIFLQLVRVSGVRGEAEDEEKGEVVVVVEEEEDVDSAQPSATEVTCRVVDFAANCGANTAECLIPSRVHVYYRRHVTVNRR